MTDTIEQKALALVNEVAKHYRANIGEAYFDEIERAFYRAVEQHEAFRQEVSDALSKADAILDDNGFARTSYARDYIRRFIIPERFDPLVEALNDLGWKYDDNGVEIATELREALAKRGYEIREKAND